MKTRPYIAYYRVSTQRQGRSGLGLEAQQQAVNVFLHGHEELIIESFTEIESGRKNDRPQLAAALDACRRYKAVLVIAKLDRLARNVHFISGLMESGVEFVAVDMPEANRLTIHILAAVAEHERETISQRTKAALQAAKARGTKAGQPRPEERCHDPFAGASGEGRPVCGQNPTHHPRTTGRGRQQLQGAGKSIECAGGSDCESAEMVWDDGEKSAGKSLASPLSCSATFRLILWHSMYWRFRESVR